MYLPRVNCVNLNSLTCPQRKCICVTAAVSLWSPVISTPGAPYLKWPVKKYLTICLSYKLTNCYRFLSPFTVKSGKLALTQSTLYKSATEIVLTSYFSSIEESFRLGFENWLMGLLLLTFIQALILVFFKQHENFRFFKRHFRK